MTTYVNEPPVEHLPYNTDSSETVETNMLLYSGAGRVFINKNFTKNQGYPLILLPSQSNARMLMEPLTS